MISPVESIDTINNRLKDRMGMFNDGRPKFRLVNANTQTETRFGEWNDFYGHIFLRSWKGVREVPKYPQFKDKWILEQLVPNPHHDVYGVLMTYEPFYVFQDKDGNPLAPEWNVIQFILHALLNGVQQEDWADWFDQENQRAAGDVKYFEAVLDNEGRTPLFAEENAVFLDSTKQKGVTDGISGVSGSKKSE